MVAAKMQGATETMWFYQGPFAAQAMFDWVKSGYFKENLPIRTDREDNFHALGDWTRVLGNKLPFIFSDLTTFESVIGGTGLSVPPPLPPPMSTPIQGPFFFPPGVHGPPPPFAGPHFRHPNGMPNFYPPHEMANHPPPDMHDSISNYSAAEPSEPVIPPTQSVGTDPIIPQLRDQTTQTAVIQISKKKAARLLSDLVGQDVQIT